MATACRQPRARDRRCTAARPGFGSGRWIRCAIAGDPTTTGRRTRPWGFVRARLHDPGTHRAWALAANDGIIATAGLLQGFAGAGAGDRLLLFTATAATIAGALSAGGAKWAEDAAEREAQLRIAEEEQRDLSTDLDAELDELARYWEGRGLSGDLARRVAEELTAHDALAAQLEWEYGFEEPIPRGVPLWSGATSGAAYAIGAAIPVLITDFAPVAIETWAILSAVTVALAGTALIVSRTGHVDWRRMLLRSLSVGACTLLVSYIAGTILL